MALKIYTKTGDDGTTSLIGGTKVLKSNIRIDAYGTIDELNSYIGLLGDHCKINEISNILAEVQDRLFTIGSSLACDPDKETKMKIPDLLDEDVLNLEGAIDQMNTVLPDMKFFIMPAGNIVVSTAHITRCICRRAERCCVQMQAEHLFIDPLVIKYLNRLSDYLFILARFIGNKMAIPEIAWRPRLSSTS